MGVMLGSFGALVMAQEKRHAGSVLGFAVGR
jgi:hypothetical protein